MEKEVMSIQNIIDRLKNSNDKQANISSLIKTLQNMDTATNPEELKILQESILSGYNQIRKNSTSAQLGEIIDSLVDIKQVELATALAERDYKFFKNSSYNGKVLMLKEALHNEFEAKEENKILKRFFSLYSNTMDLMDYAQYMTNGGTKALVKDFVKDPKISQKYKGLFIQAQKDYSINTLGEKNNWVTATATLVSTPGIIIGGTGLIVGETLGILKKGVDKATYYLAKPTKGLYKKYNKLSADVQTKGKRALAGAGKVATAIPTVIIEGTGAVIGGILKTTEYAVKIPTALASLPFFGMGLVIYNNSKNSYDKIYNSSIDKIKLRVAQLLDLPKDKKFLDDMFVSLSGNGKGITLSGLYNHCSQSFKLDFADNDFVCEEIAKRTKYGSMHLFKRDRWGVDKKFAQTIFRVYNVVAFQDPINENIKPLQSEKIM